MKHPHAAQNRGHVAGQMEGLTNRHEPAGPVASTLLEMATYEAIFTVVSMLLLQCG